MDYEAAEENLEHADNPEGIDRVRADMKSHFVHGRTQTEGDESVIKHSTNPEQHPSTEQHSELQKELEIMTERHGNDNVFVRGVAGLEHSWAEEEGDVE